MTEYEIKSENDGWESYPIEESDTDAWSTLLRIGWTEITAKHKDGRTVQFREVPKPKCRHSNYTLKTYYTNDREYSNIYFCCVCNKQYNSSAEFYDSRS